MSDVTLASRRDAVSVRAAILPALSVALVGGVVLALLIGPSLFGPLEVARALAAGLGLVDPAVVDTMTLRVVLDLRLPRAIMAAGVGAMLAAGGALMQGLFRNPLADPGLIGVSSGAALAAAAFIVFGGALVGHAGSLHYLAMPLVSFCGGLLAVTIVRRLSIRDGRTDVATMLLAGTAVNSVVFAGIGLLTVISDDAQLRSITFWSLGSLGGAGWGSVAIVVPVSLIAVAAGLLGARVLDGMMLGEVEAYCLGFRVETTKRALVLLVAAGVGAAVSFTGLIGFVGIIAPHIARVVLGPMHRQLLIGSSLTGALLLVLADTLCRVVIAPAELPIGVVTSLIGAPVFIALLLGRHRRAFRC
ncbi:FecCD family ABC transporter permease [Dongia sp.]|uniref:FecCD family ABC transporter permease n=1 Tax=Dongia sp. TaxID=1977262 RepID=UPI0035B46A1F